jgi:hypothetical protein
VNTNVSEKHTVSIFRVKASHVGKLQVMYEIAGRPEKGSYSKSYGKKKATLSLVLPKSFLALLQSLNGRLP